MTKMKQTTIRFIVWRRKFTFKGGSPSLATVALPKFNAPRVCPELCQTDAR